MLIWNMYQCGVDCKGAENTGSKQIHSQTVTRLYTDTDRDMAWYRVSVTSHETRKRGTATRCVRRTTAAAAAHSYETSLTQHSIAVLVSRTFLYDGEYNSDLFWAAVNSSNRLKAHLFLQIISTIVCYSSPTRPILGLWRITPVLVQRVFIARQHVLAYMRSYIIFYRFCSSVQCPYRVETTTHVVKVFPPSGRSITLVFWAQPASQIHGVRNAYDLWLKSPFISEPIFKQRLAPVDSQDRSYRVDSFFINSD